MIRSLLVACLGLVTNLGVACDLAGGESVELEPGVSLHYRIEPAELLVAQHFSMQFLVCGEGGALVLDGFSVDALMPAHGHGMNYKASVELQPDGLVEANGMLFHMPGSWRIRLDLSYDGRERRVELDFQV